MIFICMRNKAKEQKSQYTPYLFPWGHVAFQSLMGNLKLQYLQYCKEFHFLLIIHLIMGPSSPKRYFWRFFCPYNFILGQLDG